MKRLTITKEAAYYAIATHSQSQLYDGLPYYYHLEDVVETAKEFGFTEDKYICACYLHDTIEDSSTSYNKIKNKFGLEVAEMVWRVSDGDGRNRKEKKAGMYKKCSGHVDATIIKLLDRITNIRHSLKSSNDGKGNMYLKEYEDFKRNLYFDSEDTALLWKELDNLII